MATTTHTESRHIDALPDNQFAYIEAGGHKDASGRTVPRSKRHLPIHDAEHVRLAAARFRQTHFDSDEARHAAWMKIEHAALRFGIHLAGEHASRAPQPPDTARKVVQPHAAVAHGVELSNAEPPRWVELLQIGTFNGRDGRGPFTLVDPEVVIEATRALKMSAGIPIDYDHATDFAAPEGRPAPAAGWIRELAVRGDAIWGQVDWTEQGSQALRNKEYRYISPVFEYLRAAGDGTGMETGQVVRILRAGLTNNPNLQLKAVAAMKTSIDEQGELTSSFPGELSAVLKRLFPHAGASGLARLAAALVECTENGSEGDGADDSSEPAHSVSLSEEPEVAADEPAWSATLSMTRNTLDGQVDSRGHSEARSYLSGHRPAIASHPMVMQMAQELSAIRAERMQERAQVAVNEAIRSRHLAPAQRTFATNLYLESPQRFEEFVASSPVLLGPQEEMLARTPAAHPASGLQENERSVCARLGVSPESYVRYREYPSRGGAGGDNESALVLMKTEGK